MSAIGLACWARLRPGWIESRRIALANLTVKLSSFPPHISTNTGEDAARARCHCDAASVIAGRVRNTVRVNPRVSSSVEPTGSHELFAATLSLSHPTNVAFTIKL
jgi:hypothetical protein